MEGFGPASGTGLGPQIHATERECPFGGRSGLTGLGWRSSAGEPARFEFGTIGVQGSR